PKEMGGEGGGTNPEQLFAVGYAACFESALGVVGRRERAEVGDVSVDSRVSLLPTGERGFQLAVELDVTLLQVQDPEQAARSVAAARSRRNRTPSRLWRPVTGWRGGTGGPGTRRRCGRSGPAASGPQHRAPGGRAANRDIRRRDARTQWAAWRWSRWSTLVP